MLHLKEILPHGLIYFSGAQSMFCYNNNLLIFVNMDEANFG